MNRFDNLSNALAMHRAGELDKAERSYRQIIAEDPSNPDSIHLLGMLLHERGMHDEAIACLKSAVEISPRNSVFHNSHGVVQLALEDFDGAKRSFQQSIELQRNADALCNLADVLARQGNAEHAQEMLNAGLSLEPNHVGILLALGRQACTGHDWDAAEKFFRRCLENSLPEFSRRSVLLELAGSLNAQGRSEEVKNMMQPLIATANVDARVQLGIALGNEADHQAAAVQLREAVEIDPDSAAAWYNLSICLAAIGQEDESLRCALHASSLAGSRQTRELCVTLYRKQERFAEALDFLEHARAQDRTDVTILEQMASIHVRQDDLLSATDRLRELIRLDPSQRRALLSLAELCDQLERVDLTVQTCVDLLRQQPDSVAGHLLLGLVLSSRLAPEHRARIDLSERDDLSRRALMHLQRAAVLETSPETLDAWGIALMRCEHHPLAIEKFQEAVAIDPTFAPSHQNLGKAYLELGDLEQAKTSFQAAIHLKPDCGVAQFELARLEKEPSIERVSDLASLIDSGKRKDHVQMMLHFALARRLDAVGDADGAFKHYREANQLKVGSNKTRNAAEIVGAERLSEIFCNSYFDDKRSFGSLTDRPIFIVGMPRSGTTLVEQIIASHSSVFAAGELSDVSDIANSLTRRMKSDLPYPETVTEMGRDLVMDLADEYLARQSRLIETRQKAGDKVTRVTDKMPTNFRHLGLIATLFPNARIIHVRRNPLDVCVSCFKQNLAWPFCDLDALGDYYCGYRKIMSHWQSTLLNPMHELWYEDLIEGQENVSRRLIEFCGLSWEASCLAFSNAERAVTTPSKWQVRQPIYKTSVGAWKRYENHLGPLIARLQNVVD